MNYPNDDDLQIPISRAFKAALFGLVAVLVCFGGVLAVSINSGNTGPADALQIGATDLSAWTSEEAAAADSEMWDQLAAGWVAYGSYGADSREPVRGWIHLRATSGSVDFDLVRSQNETNFGGLPVFDGPDGNQIGVHFSMVGFVTLSGAPTFDPSAARLRNFGCDPLAVDVSVGQECMAKVIEAENAKGGESRVANSN